MSYVELQAFSIWGSLMSLPLSLLSISPFSISLHLFLLRDSTTPLRIFNASAVEDIHGPRQLLHIVLLTNVMKYWHLNTVFKRCEMYRQTLAGHDKFPVGLPHWNFESPSKKVTMALCCIFLITFSPHSHHHPPYASFILNVSKSQIHLKKLHQKQFFVSY